MYKQVIIKLNFKEEGTCNVMEIFFKSTTLRVTPCLISAMFHRVSQHEVAAKAPADSRQKHVQHGRR